MKTRTIFYYVTVEGLRQAQELAKREREARNVAYTRDASRFITIDAEACEHVVIMKDVPPHYRTLLEQSYGKKVKNLDKVDIPPPIPEEPVIAQAPAQQVDEEPDLEMMTRTALREHAAKRGITLDPALHKREDIMAAIKAAA